MSFISLPLGIYRTTADAFVPKSMIDTLFDYNDFLKKASDSGIAEGPSTSQSIAVVGAGAAGLVAAFELSRIKNIKVTLYEASDSFGGRMASINHTDENYNPKIFELGCMRFPPTSHTLYHYLDHFKLVPTGQFPDPGKVKTLLGYKGNAINWKAGQSFPDDADFKRIGENLGKIIIHLLGDANNPNIANPETLIDWWGVYQLTPADVNKAELIKKWQSIIDEFKDETFYHAIFRLSQNTDITGGQPWSVEDMNKFGALGVGSGGFGSLYEINFVEILRLFTNGWEVGQQFLEEGIGELVNQIVLGLGNNGADTLSKTKVNSITKTDDKYNVTTSTGVVGKYDAVIVSTTTRAMHYMGLTTIHSTPILDQDAKVAIRDLHLMNSSKFFVLTKNKFWYKENNDKKEDLPANIQTDELIRGLYCLDYDIDKTDPTTRKPNGMGVVLVSYVWGDDSIKLLALTDDERYAQFLSALKDIDPVFSALLESTTLITKSIDWENTTFQYGAFKLNYPGQEQANHDAFFQFQGEKGLILAGDSVSWAGGWVEGAMTTGVNAACAAALHVGGKLPAVSPISGIPVDMYKYDGAPLT